MTGSHEETSKLRDPEPGAPPQEVDVRHDLDTEIVDDLEVDGRADDVRGGCGAMTHMPAAGK